MGPNPALLITESAAFQNGHAAQFHQREIIENHLDINGHDQRYQSDGEDVAGRNETNDEADISELFHHEELIDYNVKWRLGLNRYTTFFF